MKWEEWSPPNMPHVVGRYTLREFDARGLPEPQKIKADCKTCGDHYETMCSTGRVREKILIFAYQHLHRDPLA